MSAETPRTPREELEIQITALLMGQLEPEEAQALEAQIAADPGLVKLQARLRRAAELLREATALPEQPATPAPVQLSTERRERLLAHFKTPPPASPVPVASIVRPRAKRRDWSWLTPLSLAASLVALLGGSIVLSTIRQRKVQHNVALQSRMQNAEIAHADVIDEKTSTRFFGYLRGLWGENRETHTASSSDENWSDLDVNGKTVSNLPAASPAAPGNSAAREIVNEQFAFKKNSSTAPAGAVAQTTHYRDGVRPVADATTSLSTNGGTLTGAISNGDAVTGTGGTIVSNGTLMARGHGIYLPETPPTPSEPAEFEMRNTGVALEVESTTESDAPATRTGGGVHGLEVAGAGGMTKSGSGTLTMNSNAITFGGSIAGVAAPTGPASTPDAALPTAVIAPMRKPASGGKPGRGVGGGGSGGEGRIAGNDLYLPPTEENGRTLDKLSSEQKGVPIMGDIPVLGKLFRSDQPGASTYDLLDERSKVAGDPAQPVREAKAELNDVDSDALVAAGRAVLPQKVLDAKGKDASKNQSDVILDGNNTYSGGTTITSGKLALTDNSGSMASDSTTEALRYRRSENQAGIPGMDDGVTLSLGDNYSNSSKPEANDYADFASAPKGPQPASATPPPPANLAPAAKGALGTYFADLPEDREKFERSSPNQNANSATGEKVKQLQVEAKGYYDTGRYDLAFKRAEQMLNIDPYNKEARALEEQINRAKSDYYITGYNETRSRAVAQVDRAWANPVRRFNVDPNAPAAEKPDSVGKPVDNYPLTSGNRSGSTAINSNAIDALLFGNSAGVGQAAEQALKPLQPGSQPTSERGETKGAEYAQKLAEPTVQFQAEPELSITPGAEITALHDELRQVADEMKKSGATAEAQALNEKLAATGAGDTKVGKQLQQTMNQLKDLAQLPEGENVFYGGGTSATSPGTTVLKQQEILARQDKLLEESKPLLVENDKKSELRDGFVEGLTEDRNEMADGVVKHRKQPDLLEQLEGPSRGQGQGQGSQNTPDNSESEKLRRELMLSLDDDPVSLEKRADGKKIAEKTEKPVQKQSSDVDSVRRLNYAREAVEVAKLREFQKKKALEDAEETKKAAQAAELSKIKEEDERRTATASLPAPTPQPEVATSANAVSTFSLNVSDVAFKLAAASLEQGKMPELGTLRSEEFLNAFDYRDPEPAPGLPLAFVTERARYPFAQNRDLLRFSVKTAAVGRQVGKPLNLVLLIDNSGSMERADRVRTLREAMRVLCAQLKPQDKLSVVTFARTPRLWADGVAGDKAGEVTARVGEITPQGGTNLDAALELGYQTAVRHYQPGSINRVVVLTDGAANLGDVKPEELKKKVEKRRQQGIALDCFGIGWEGLNDDLLEQLSRNGDGRYGFVNTPEEAATQFAAQLAGALRVAASDVKVQVEFNPKRVTAYRQVGYAKHQLKKEDFRNNAVDAAEIGAAESGNALYVVETNPRGEGDLGVVRVRYKVPGTNEYREQEWPVPYTSSVPALDQASCAMRLAGTSAAFAEWLASSPYATEVTPDRLLKLMNGVSANYGADPRPQKLEWMIRQAKSISGR